MCKCSSANNTKYCECQDQSRNAQTVRNNKQCALREARRWRKKVIEAKCREKESAGDTYQHRKHVAPIAVSGLCAVRCVVCLDKSCERGQRNTATQSDDGRVAKKPPVCSLMAHGVRKPPNMWLTRSGPKCSSAYYMRSGVASCRWFCSFFPALSKPKRLSSSPSRRGQNDWWLTPPFLAPTPPSGPPTPRIVFPTAPPGFPTYPRGSPTAPLEAPTYPPGSPTA